MPPPPNLQIAPKVSHCFGDVGRLFIHKSVDVQSAFFNTMSGNICVHENCMFGHHVNLLTGRHDPDETGRQRIINYTKSGNDIEIESGVWLASNVTVLGGVKIGKNSCIAAGSVVARDIPPNQLWGGVPARFIRDLKSVTSENTEAK